MKKVTQTVAAAILAGLFVGQTAFANEGESAAPATDSTTTETAEQSCGGKGGQKCGQKMKKMKKKMECKSGKGEKCDGEKGNKCGAETCGGKTEDKK